jgi:hypothetical protein
MSRSPREDREDVERLSAIQNGCTVQGGIIEMR